MASKVVHSLTRRSRRRLETVRIPSPIHILELTAIEAPWDNSLNLTTPLNTDDGEMSNDAIEKFKSEFPPVQVDWSSDESESEADSENHFGFHLPPSTNSLSRSFHRSMRMGRLMRAKARPTQRINSNAQRLCHFVYLSMPSIFQRTLN
jgi:hypothetical protein